MAGRGDQHEKVDCTIEHDKTMSLRNCDRAMLAGASNKEKGSEAHATADAGQDIIVLLLLIREYCCQFNDNQQSTWALEQEKHHISTFFQMHSMINTDYMEQFETHRGGHGNIWGSIWAGTRITKDAAPRSRSGHG